MKKQLLIVLFSFSILPALLSQIAKESGYPEYRNDSCYFDDGGCQYLLTIDSDNTWQVANTIKTNFYRCTELSKCTCN